MKFFSFTTGNYASSGIEHSGGRTDFNKAFAFYTNTGGTPPSLSMMDIIERGFCTRSYVERLVRFVRKNRLMEACAVPSRFRFDVPVAYPRKILCLGLNYEKHARELGHELPAEPLFFSKLPSCLQAHNRPIVIPWFEDERVDHEVELAVVIGRKGHHIAERNAMGYVAGYTMFNDVTARAVQARAMERGNPWTRSKGYDTFGPVGPYLVPRAFIDDPHTLDLSLSVNGEVRQKSNTSDMIFSIPAVVSHLSRCFTLFPGDIISTGTPEGVGALLPGDRVEMSVAKLGTLCNPVVKERRTE